MRVLIVNAYPASSKRGRERFEQFRRHVTRVVRELQRAEVTRVEIEEKHRSNLDSFLFELHSEFADPNNITNFDQLDFVFVDGDANSSPWAPNMRKLALLTKMCMMTGKCFFGSGIGASLVAFSCSTGGEHLRVLNNDGKGSLIDKLQDVPPPPPDSRSIGFVSPRGGDNNVLLDIKSGDFFVFAEKHHSWVPKGNTGLVLHSSDSARCYGARPNSARAGGKKTNVGQISQPLFLAKRGELRCCIRLEVANQHPVITTTFPRQRELVLNCKSKWDLDEEIVSTGGNKYRVLIDSSRGPMLVEFGNCFGSHFELASEYPETLALLRNFTLTKYEELKVHAHIDRSFVSAISGSARLKQRFAMAQTKQVGSTRTEGISNAKTNNTHLVEGHEGIGVGRTSPKRCRPVSAGPYRSKPHEAIARRIHTSRSAYPSPTSEAYHTKPRRVVRVPQKNELARPYCAQHRFVKMRKEEKSLANGYYSVVNDAPYTSAYEQEAVAKQRSKLKWMGGPFRTVFGKASTHVVPEASIFVKDPFVQENVPFYMTQRRQLEVDETKRPSPPQQHKVRQKARGN
ncbi:hypothetical protein PHYSODRAFT_481022 [Phytophthora sojae]|uniref:Uncharacterized protein n=1 Tax=Phytophthora sojae (strain P6497) TaxID=1094619 RepID=G4YTI4_PHYSP|nr:hypothetical protein PHYSODRAFT_481022 [Phytophthora sojae]EGZ23583.1 hypothetical protein PHYSODRAFT_481022 [Phytophthora sojae]|eukprot:XP_009518871.1 hypothetical protein PHYSODRAFT_481022 [Phytophthora sojae]